MQRILILFVFCLPLSSLSLNTPTHVEGQNGIVFLTADTHVDEGEEPAALCQAVAVRSDFHITTTNCTVNSLGCDVTLRCSTEYVFEETGESTMSFRLGLGTERSYSVVCKATREATQTGYVILFRMDVQLESMHEAIEEIQGGKVCHFNCSNVPNTQGSEFSRNLYEVKIWLYPKSYHDADQDSILVEAPIGELYELIDGEYVPAVGEYPYLDISRHQFFLHGHQISTTGNDHSVAVRHRQNGCLDRFRYTVYDVQIRFFYYSNEARTERIYFNSSSPPAPSTMPILYDFNGRLASLPEEWQSFGLRLDGYTNLDFADVTWECPVFFVNFWNQVQIRPAFRGTFYGPVIYLPYDVYYSPHVLDGTHLQATSLAVLFDETGLWTYAYGRIAHYHELGHLAVCLGFIRSGLGSWIRSELNSKKAASSPRDFNNDAAQALTSVLSRPLGFAFNRINPLVAMPETVSRETAIAGGGDVGTMRSSQTANGTMLPGWSLHSGAGQCPIELSYKPPSADGLSSPQEEDERRPADAPALDADDKQTSRESLP